MDIPFIMDGTAAAAAAAAAVAVVFKKNLNAAKKTPEQSKGLRGNIGCKFCSVINWRLRRQSMHLPVDIFL